MRRRKTAVLLVLTALLAAGFLLWGNCSLQTTETALVSPALPPAFDGLRIVELADLPAAEQCRQHGGLVAYGTLLLLLCDGQKEEFERFFRFCRSIGLPTCREDTCASEADIHRVFQATEKKQDVSVMPYKITQDMLHAAARDLEAYHAQQDKPEKILGKK